MGVYIKDMEMPIEKSRIIQIYPDGTVRRIDGSIFNSHFEAVPVPPHGRLGDLDALAESVTTPGIFPPVVSSEVFAFLRNAPTIIPAEEGET